MTHVATTMRLIASLAGFLLAASTAQAVPSIAIQWRSTGTPTIASPAAGSTQVADIVITTVTETIVGIFVSIEFDNVELTAISVKELASVNLPGMGNEFKPILIGTTIDNASGLITDFDTGTFSTGLVGGQVRTLGSVTFHVVAASDSPYEIDVIASLQDSGRDSIVDGDLESISANFVGASITGPGDQDGDGMDDVSDNCPATFNPSQEDTDANGTGDACNGFEDTDGDEWADGLDNCPVASNPDQADLNNNGIGDVCEVTVPSSSSGVRLLLTLVLLVCGFRSIAWQRREHRADSRSRDPAIRANR